MGLNSYFHAFKFGVACASSVEFPALAESVENAMVTEGKGGLFRLGFRKINIVLCFVQPSVDNAAARLELFRDI